jgi:D-methionine transport system permease protein
VWVSKWIEWLPDLEKAFTQTVEMVGISLLIAVILGLPLGIFLFITDKGLFFENKAVHLVLSLLANLIRSVPFIILLVALLPFTQWIAGTTIGPLAASVPLSVAAIPFYARLVETSMRDIPRGVIEAAISMGATPWLIIREVLLPEAKPGVISGLTVTAISLVGYSAMAGIVGGGGVGDLAIRFGYYRYENDVMIITVAVLIFLVQLLQWLGDTIRQKTDKR